MIELVHLDSARRAAAGLVRPLVQGAGACGVATIVLAGAGCDGSFDDSHLRTVPVTVDAACDPDGVELEYETGYANANGDHHIDAVVVRGIADACAGGTVTVELRTEDRGAEYVYAGSSGVAVGGPTVVRPSPTFDVRDDRGIVVADAQIIHALVTAIDVSIQG